MSVILYWFRNDLRIGDNDGLRAAALAGKILPVYIYADDCGAASRCWLHHSLVSLNRSLRGALRCYRGTPETIIPRLCREFDVDALYFTHSYHPRKSEDDERLFKYLDGTGVTVKGFTGCQLWDPESVSKKDGSPYKIFTPYYKRALASFWPQGRIQDSFEMQLCPGDAGLSPCSLQLLPSHPWGKRVMEHWQVGEAAAGRRMAEFVENDLVDYGEGRDFPGRDRTSRLSAHLHFGEISVLRLWQEVEKHGADLNVGSFKSELGWRDFSYYLHHHFPELPFRSFKDKYEKFPWRDDDEGFARWCRGETGIPFVDAGMRQLWQTGFMHNRLRMITASFLVKNLLIDWRRGAAWFMDCLLDADEASNSAGWQWVAGSGADSSPYFRIFNPVSQGMKFDADGVYTCRYVPELAGLSGKNLFAPWQASAEVLMQADITLGLEYPRPIVDLADSRKRALAAYATIS